MNINDLLSDTKKLYLNIKSESDRLNFSKFNKNSIRKVLNKLKQPNLSHAEKLKFENTLSLLKSFREKIHQHEIKHGSGGIAEGAGPSGLQHNSNRLPKRIAWKIIASAFKSRIITATVINLAYKDPSRFLKDCIKILTIKLRNILKKSGAIKIHLKLCCEFELLSTGENDYKHFVTKNMEILMENNIKDVLLELIEIILRKIEEFESRGSGWTYRTTSYLIISINKFSPITGGVSTYIPLPATLRKRKGIINIKNTDSRCFIWSILSHLYPTCNNVECGESYPQNIHEIFNLRNIEMPMKLSDIYKFEEQNPSISINVFSVDKITGTLNGPLYHTKETKQHHINLLYITKNVFSKIGHYCLITDLSKLVRKNVTNHKSKIFVCDSCLNHFSVESKLVDHRNNCSLFNPVKILLPDKTNNILEFTNFKALIMKGFTLYADFECFTRKFSLCLPNPLAPFTSKSEKHEPYSVAYTLVCSFNEKYDKFRIYRGPNATKWFVDSLKMECLEISNILKKENNKKMIPLTNEEKHAFEIADKCYVCDRSFSENNKKVSCICNVCNLKIQVDFRVPIFFHNLNYDMNLFLRELSKISQIKILPLNHENYISFSLFIGDINLVFLDSYRFLPASLDELSKNLKREDLFRVRNHFKDNDKFNLAIRKGVFPYDYVSSWKKLNETILPKKKIFFNKLTNEDIKESDYQHALAVWKSFDVQNLGEYSDIYLKIDVLLLASVFESFRKLTFDHFGLDGAAFYTLPGLSFQAALKMSKIKLELLTDIDQILFIEKALRGGIVQSIHRYSKCNNKYYMPTYDPSKPEKYLVYWDLNNLYGWGQCQSLPVGEFKWLNLEENKIILENLKNNPTLLYNKYGKSAEKSIILEIDLLYPRHLHDDHKFLPFCPEHKLCPNSKTEKKLMCTLTDKKQYVIHFENLIQCLQNGLLIDKIHRILEFTQRAWLKGFIEFNTKKRMEADNKFEMDFFKFVINANYGKTIERDRKKRNIKLVNSWNIARKYISKPEFKTLTIYSENLISVELRKTEILFNKPIYTGFTILELSKNLFYDFYYEYVKKNICPYFDTKICYIDTDAFIFEFTLKSGVDDITIYDIIKKDAHTHFDTFGYPENNIFGIEKVNNKLPGLMKDELKGKIMTEFISLRSKVYTYKVDGCDVRCKIKGVSKAGTKDISFEDFFNCLFKNKQKIVNFNTIRSINHENFTVNVNKVALDSSDNKRVILSNGIETLPIGHYSILKQ